MSLPFLTVFLNEIVISHGYVYDPLYESDHCRYECPAKQQIDNAPANAAKIEFMNTKTTKKESKQNCGDS